MAPEVAVAVVSWNTRELLRRCLESLRPVADGGLAEVWVVDNDSADGSAGMVAGEFPWVRLIRSRENVGYGSAVNLVAAQSRSPWLAAANSDIEAEPGALAALLAGGEADPGAAAVAPRLILSDGSTQHSVHAFPGIGLALAFNLGLHRLSRRLGDRLCIEGRWNPDRARRVDWAHGAFLLVRRDAFEQIGGFDSGQWMYAEDLDLCWRLSRAGHAIRYEPAARVGHAVAAATAQAFGDDAERAARHIAASYAWMARRRGMLLTWATAVVNVAGAALRLNRRYVSLHRSGLRRRARLEAGGPAPA